MIRRRAYRALSWALFFTVVLLAGPLAALALGMAPWGSDWSRASNRSIGVAPDPADHPGAVVQAYAARTFGWRGAFAVHTWIAAKPAGAERYTRYEVIGWHGRGGGSTVAISQARAPDAEWYGQAPELLRDLRGADAEAVISRLPAVVEAYPYATGYRMWPGPNSNTFIAHIARTIPELELALPANAIGKDWLPLGEPFARAPSGTGWQASLYGVLGVTAAAKEGLEVNVLGLVIGVDPGAPAVKFPGVGHVP